MTKSIFPENIIAFSKQKDVFRLGALATTALGGAGGNTPGDTPGEGTNQGQPSAAFGNFINI